jgi:hypothetical protein
MFQISKAISEKYKISKETLEKIEQVKNWDLEFLTSAFNDNLIRAGRAYSVEQVYPIISKFGKADYEIAKLLEVEYRKFVALTLVKPNIPHAPSGAIDMYWHFFILHTKDYTEFCEKVWGNFEGDPRFRHHYPANDDTRPGMLNAYKETLNLYREVFGEPRLYERIGARPVEVWTAESQTSGDSYSGIIDPSMYKDFGIETNEK